MLTAIPKPSPSSAPPQEPVSVDASHKNERTVVWGADIEKGDFLIVPRSLMYMGKYDTDVGTKILPRHILLLLVLAARRFKKKRIRAYWEELGNELGVKAGTARKWGYELKKLGLINISQHRGRDPVTNKPGIRNERNSFDISPFVARVEKAFKRRQKLRNEARARRAVKDE